MPSLSRVIPVLLLIGFLVIFAACDSLQTATKVPVTPTPKAPEYEANEVIGIVQNKMKIDCGSEGLLARINAYTARPVYDRIGTPYPTPTYFLTDIHGTPYHPTWLSGTSGARSFSGKWVITWQYNNNHPIFQWEFYEDSKTVVQISRDLGGYC